MTQATKLYVKNNWFSVANLILLIGIIINLSSWKQKVDDDIKLLIEHKLSSDEHMPFEKKINIFVPRIEIESRMDAIKNQLNRIENKLDAKK